MQSSLAFLNKGNVVHGGVAVDAIFVTAAGDWKLSGFEVTSDLADPAGTIRVRNELPRERERERERERARSTDSSHAVPA